MKKKTKLKKRRKISSKKESKKKIKKPISRKPKKQKKNIRKINSKLSKKKIPFNIKRKNNIILSFIKFQERIIAKFNFRFKLDVFYIDRAIYNFFQKIESKINEYKILRSDEKRRIKIEELERVKREKEKKDIEKKQQEELQFQLKQKQLKDEERIETESTRDIKLFLRKEQAILRKEQAERQRKFLQELKLDQQIQKFRVREVKELEKLEKISLGEKRDNYSGLQDRIEKLKEKYRLIRDQKIRERVEALGIKTFKKDDRDTLLQREKEYTLARHKIEMALESFYRSASSLVFQLNKRHITRDMSIFRCIDRRFETGEIFIKWDESDDENWLILIYIKDNSPNKGIVIEDKSNYEKNQSYEFKPSEIFKASDLMVDSLTQLLAKERSKKES